MAIYAPMIYTAPYVMCFMCVDSLQVQVGGGMGPGNRDFFGPFCTLMRNDKSLFLLQSESIFALQFSISILRRKRGLILNGTKFYRTSNLNDETLSKLVCSHKLQFSYAYMATLFRV
jgi:hypothetical protein